MILYDATRGRWLRFPRPQDVLCARSIGEVVPLLEEVERRVAHERAWAAGLLAYEASPAFDSAFAVHDPDPGGFPLAWFGIFAAEPQPAALPAPDRAVGRETGGRDGLASVAWAPSIDRDAYRAAIRAVLDRIASGDTYQANFTFRLRASLGSGDRWQRFLRMIAAQGPGYGAYLQAGRWTILSASPELFYSHDEGRIVSKPMKGTAHRGLWSEADERAAAALRASEKDRAENVMIVDMVRHDLGRIAEPGTVQVERLFDVERYPTVWQMTSTVACRTRAGLVEQMRALFPPASITGAPKVRTMEILASLETTPRRIYTGTIGFLAPGGRSQWSVAIRTVVVDRETGEAEYGVGGGIVWDSTEEGEYEECRTKAKVLEHRLPAFALLETIRWTPEERFVLLEPHLARLAASSVYFGRALDRDRIVRKLEEAERRFSHAPLRVRLIVEADGAARVEAEPLRAPFPEPYRLRLASSPIDPADPLLYHKTTARSVYDRALEEARAAGCDDALLWNPDGEVTETTIANLAIERGGRLLTPPVRSGLLPGTLRAALLEEGKLAEAPIRIDDLRDGARILLLNSVRGIWPATLVALR